MASVEQDPASTPGPGAKPAAHPGAAPRARLRIALQLVACAVAAESLATVVLYVLPFPAGAAARLAVHAILLAALLAPAALLLANRTGEKAIEAPRDPAISALEAAANGIVLVNPQGTILWANRAFLALTGYEAGELVGRHTRVLKSGCHDDAFYANLWKTVSSGRVWHGVVVNRRKDGSLYTEEMTITPVVAPEGTITHYVAIKQDISRRLATDRALLDAQRRFNSFMDDSPAVAFVKDSAGRYLYINRMFESVFNVTSDQILGRTDFDIWPEPVAAQFREHDLQILTHGQARQFSELTETADGSLRRWLVLKFPISHSDGSRVVAGVAVDVTALQGSAEATAERENQIRKAQRLEALGRLAAGVAHDFNNLLTAILGYGQLLRAHVPRDSAARKDAEEILRAAERATDLTRQLLAFSREQPMEASVVDLNETLLSMSKMFERLIGEGIHLSLHLDEGLWKVKADAAQLGQVVMNLVVNARDAMPGGGQLTIATRNFDALGPEAIDHPAIPPGACVVLEVADTGCGMDSATQSRLFEPFFTTKGPERGTGLGLSVVYGIVRQNNGEIQVSSAPGCGTTFRIFLPRTLEEKVEPAPTPADRESLRGSERVLVVEDSDQVRRVAQEILTRFGYRVAEASGGEQAMQVLATDPTGPDLALIDLVLGGMNGCAVAELLRHAYPGIRVLFMSGYDEKQIPDDARPRSGEMRIQKPISADHLLRKVREALDRKTASVDGGV